MLDIISATFSSRRSSASFCIFWNSASQSFSLPSARRADDTPKGLFRKSQKNFRGNSHVINVNISASFVHGREGEGAIMVRKCSGGKAKDCIAFFSTSTSGFSLFQKDTTGHVGTGDKQTNTHFICCQENPATKIRSHGKLSPFQLNIPGSRNKSRCGGAKSSDKKSLLHHFRLAH